MPAPPKNHKAKVAIRHPKQTAETGRWGDREKFSPSLCLSFSRSVFGGESSDRTHPFSLFLGVWRETLIQPADCDRCHCRVASVCGQQALELGQLLLKFIARLFVALLVAPCSFYSF
jgi:hypothetical protein